MNNGNAAILTVKDLKTYFFQDEGTTKAVDGVSFTLYPGKTLGVVGESGCGKSVTALSILQLVQRPGRIVNGEIILHKLQGQFDPGNQVGVDIARLDPYGAEMRKIQGAEIALVFQEPMTSFSPVHTIGNQIVEAIRLHEDLSKDDARQKAIKGLGSVGIPNPEQRIDSYPFQLSGGLRQRAMIAMALSSDPTILIADEPTTALDVTTQAQILDLLREIQEERHMATILITHNMGVIAEMADDVVVMYLGRVVEVGPVDEIFHTPKHPYTRKLLASVPSIMSKPRTKLATISGTIPHPYSRPKGCAFHPRCPDFIPGTCDRWEPEMKPISTKQRVSCFLHHPPDPKIENANQQELVS